MTKLTISTKCFDRDGTFWTSINKNTHREEGPAEYNGWCSKSWYLEGYKYFFVAGKKNLMKKEISRKKIDRAGVYWVAVVKDNYHREFGPACIDLTGSDWLQLTWDLCNNTYFKIKLTNESIQTHSK